MSGQSRTWRVDWWTGAPVYHLHVGKCSIAKAERSAALDVWTDRRERSSGKMPRTRSGTESQARKRGLARCGECGGRERRHEDALTRKMAELRRQISGGR